MSSPRLPAITRDRIAFWGTFIVGMALCSGGGISQAVVRGWLHPISIVGYLLGTLAVLLGISVLFRIRVGPIQSDQAALIALVAVIAAKFVAALFYSLI